MEAKKTTAKEENRGKIIVRTGMIGILANLLLAAFKVTIGFFSSVITIVGTKLSEKPADRDHPMGHGRTEYLTASVISLIVLYAGVTSLVESVKKIFHPETPEYHALTIAILFVAVIVKILLGLYVKKTGIVVHSDSLKAQGQDALQDAVISASTILAALIFISYLSGGLPWHRNFYLYRKSRV